MLKNVSGKKVLILFGIYLIFAAIIFPALPHSNAGIPDIKYYYSAEEVYQIIANYTPAERRNYALSSMTVDVLYPLVYSLFLTALSIFLIGKLNIRKHLTIRLAYISMGAAAFDLLENGSLTVMMLNYPVRFNILADVAGYFTAAKWTLVIASLAFIIYLSIRLLLKKIRKQL